MNRTAILAVSLVALGCVSFTNAFACPQMVATDESWIELDATLTEIEEGPRDRVLELAELNFAWPMNTEERFPSEAESAAGRLLRFMAGEKDPFVVHKMASSLAWIGSKALEPIGELLLHHPAPSVRISAVAIGEAVCSEAQVDRARRLLEVESVHWVRAGLFAMLTDCEQRDHLPVCAGAVLSVHEATATEAMRCMAALKGPGDIESLVERATAGPSLQRAQALHVLAEKCSFVRAPEDRAALLERVDAIPDDGTLPDVQWELTQLRATLGSERAAAKIREWARSEDDDLAEWAFYSLAMSSGPQAREVLIDIAADAEAWMNEEAFEALARMPLDDELLEFLVASVAPDRPEEIRWGAVDALVGAGEPVDDDFFDLAPDDVARGGRPPDELERVVSTLGVVAASDPDELLRDTAAESLDAIDRGLQWVDWETWLDEGNDFPAESRFEFIREAATHTSRRCFAEPGVTYPADKPVRVEAGRIYSTDLYDDGRAAWVNLTVGNPDTSDPAARYLSCWLLASWIERRDSVHEMTLPEISRTEVDLPLSVTSSEEFLRLERVGAVETFDTEGEVVGVRLTLDWNDERARELLRRAEGLAETPLQRLVDEMLWLRLLNGDGYQGWAAWEEVPPAASASMALSLISVAEPRH